MTAHKPPFWQTKSFEQMTEEEWESLCDGCGKCCVNKLECEETHEVFFTHLACKYLDLDTCRCTDYTNRLELTAECIKLDKDSFSSFNFLPNTCAYRLLHEDKDLFEWHPLVSGEKIPESLSIGPLLISEEGIEIDDFEDYVIDWINV